MKLKYIFKFILIISWTVSWSKVPCKNGANNYPKCDKCPEGKIFMANQCAITVTPPTSVEVEPIEHEPYVPPKFQKCPQGQIFINGGCAIYGVPEEGK
jgi:hypothetical protein